MAIVLVCRVFGWNGGKRLASASYIDAKEKTAEMKAERKEKKADKEASKQDDSAPLVDE